MDRQSLLEQAKAKRDRDALLAEAKAKRDADAANLASETEVPFANKIETGARSFLEGQTLGISEPIISGANALVGQAIDAGFNEENNPDKEFTWENIKKAYEQDVNRRRELEAELPVISTGAEIAGAVIPGLIGAPAALNVGGKVAQSVAGGSKALSGAIAASKAGEFASKIPLASRVGRIGAAGLEGAASALGTEGLKRLVETPTGFIREEDQLPGLGEFAAMGAKIGAGARAVPEVIGTLKAGGKSVLSAIGGPKPEVIDEYLKNGPAVRDAKSISDAKEIVDQAAQTVQDAVRGQRADFADNTVQAVEALKEKVIQGSNEAYEILDAVSKRNPVSGTIRKGTERIPTANIKRAITAAKKDLQVGGVAVGPSAKGAVKALEDIRSDISQLPAEITLSEAKRILQSLDKSISWARGAGEFGDEASQAIKSVRGALDSQVKSRVPEYAEKMVQVASDAQLLEEAAAKFGTSEKVYGMADRLSKGEKLIEMDALKRLESSTGKSLSPQLSSLKSSAPIMGINPQNSEGFIKSIMNGSSIENKKKLALLSKLSNQDLVTMVKNTGTAQAFEKEFRAGAQHTNMWAILGGGSLGAFTGDQVGGTPGSMAGAVLGAMTTKFGPTATRKVLDGISKIQGMPTVQKINAVMASVPDQVRADVINDLIQGMAIYKDNGPIQIQGPERKQLRLDIAQSPGLSNVEKARALDQLNREGSVSHKYMQKIVTGKKDLEQMEAQKRPLIQRTPSQAPVNKMKQVSDYFQEKREEKY